MQSSFPEINKLCNVASCWKYIKNYEVSQEMFEQLLKEIIHHKESLQVCCNGFYESQQLFCICSVPEVNAIFIMPLSDNYGLDSSLIRKSTLQSCVFFWYSVQRQWQFSPTFLQKRFTHTHLSLHIFNCVPKCCRHSPCTAKSLKTGPIDFSKTSKTNYLSKLRKNTKELRSQLHRSRSRTSQMLMGLGALQKIPRI